MFDIKGLVKLSQMREICKLIQNQKDVAFNIEKIPIDDEKTIKLFQQGRTEYIDQSCSRQMFNSQDMQRCLRDFRPTCFEDLAMLYSICRPETQRYIPQIIERKRLNKQIEYEIPCVEECLHDTYGFIVYDEQLIMLSRTIAGFIGQESELLRGAIEERNVAMLMVLKYRFIEGGMKNGYKKIALEKVWDFMRNKGKSAFPKSYAVCYTLLAYQMAYLKANYPEEFDQVMMPYYSHYHKG